MYFLLVGMNENKSTDTAWHEAAADHLEHSIKEDFSNMDLITLLGLENLFYKYNKGQPCTDYVYSLLAAEIERKVR